MSDEESYAGPNGAEADAGPESLAEFMATGAGGTAGASEEEGGAGGDGDKAPEDAPPSDDPGDTEGEPGDRRAETVSRLTRKMAQRERELSDHRTMVRDRDRRIKELESQLAEGRRDPADAIELVRGYYARRLGAKPDDPRVASAIAELTEDLIMAGVDPKSLEDPSMEPLRRRREERDRDRRDREWKRSLEERLAAAEREKAQAKEAQATAAAMSYAVGIVKADEARYPFLFAQDEVDPGRYVAEAAIDAIRSGKWQDTSEAGERRLLHLLANEADMHYRKLAARLSTKLSGDAASADENAGSRLDVRGTDAAKAKKRTQTKRAGATGTGGGGRGRADARTQTEDDGEEDLATFMRRQMASERASRPGGR